ncbi:MAG: type IV pilin protein [bacterium]
MKRFFNFKNKKGFTLIELMIVVAIIGILAAIAIPNFLNFRNKAKSAEAKSNLGAIRSCQETYNTEFETYLACSDNPGSGGCGRNKQTWVATNTDFSAIGFDPQGGVYYSYVVDGAAQDTYEIHAWGDVDGDGNFMEFTVNQDGGDVRASTTTTY